MLVEERVKARQSDLIQQSWLTEYYARHKRLPKLADELARIDGQQDRRLSGEDAVRFIKALTLSQGGDIQNTRQD